MAFAEIRYFSGAIGKQNSANVILPDVPGPWQVMFLLHGMSDDHTIWSRRSRIESYVTELPLLVVMPDGGRSFYCDAVEGFAYNTAIAHELPSLIRRWFPVRDRWCVTGLSMGGYGAMRLALDDPELFASTCALSAALNFGHDPEYRTGENREFARIVGSDPAGGPNDLYHLISVLAPERRPHIRIDCGREDFLIEHNREFHRHLDGLGVPHEYEERPGDHNWDYWDLTVRPAIEFHRRNLQF
jgi:S-formylglutathione hydrolase FrmB